MVWEFCIIPIMTWKLHALRQILISWNEYWVLDSGCLIVLVFISLCWLSFSEYGGCHSLTLLIFILWLCWLSFSDCADFYSLDVLIFILCLSWLSFSDSAGCHFLTVLVVILWLYWFSLDCWAFFFQACYWKWYQL